MKLRHANFFSVITLLLCFITISVFAAPKMHPSATDDAIVVNNYNELYNTIKRAVEKCDDGINIKIKNNYLNGDFKAFSDTFEKIINKITEDDPDIRYIESWNISSNVIGNNVKITFNYRYSKEKILREKAEVEKKAKAIISSIIKPNMTDLQKEIVIHNYVVKNTRYDYENYIRGTIPEDSFTSYGALIKGVAVCSGYASAINKLLNMAGVESMVIIGEAKGISSSYVPHAWNLVKLDGSYYHLDATFDDPIYIINGKKKDVLKFDYFNLTDKQISKNHKWDKNKYPKCTSSKYKRTGDS